MVIHIRPVFSLRHTHASIKSLVGELVQRLSETLTIVVIEHDMSFVLSLSHHISVLHQGVVIAGGPPAAIRENAEVRECYLGTLKYTRRA